MRKRMNGVYRADTGFSGPTRRYVLIVALLVGLASMPTLAAITAGSNELADGKTDTMDIPFLPPASPGPIRGASRSPLPSSSASAASKAGPSPSVSPSDPGAGADPGASGDVGPSGDLGAAIAGAVKRAGRLAGTVGERRRWSGPSSASGSAGRGESDVSGYAGSTGSSRS